MKPIVIDVSSGDNPIRKSPGFYKKKLVGDPNKPVGKPSTDDPMGYHLELMQICGFGCTYCYTNVLTPIRLAKQKWAEQAKIEHGREYFPEKDPEFSVQSSDVVPKLEAQLKQRGPSFGEGRVLILSQMTDAFSPNLLKDGTTLRALTLLMEKTKFRVRILTKNAAVGNKFWVKWLSQWPTDRVVVGLSIGTLDNRWTRTVELGTSVPQARLRALRALQDAGVSTFGMLCPVFPDQATEKSLEKLIGEIRPERCEHIWVEPYNDRANWQKVREGFDLGSFAYTWFTEVYVNGRKDIWSQYATDLFTNSYNLLGEHQGKLRYLLYEKDIQSEHVDSLKRDGKIAPEILLQNTTKGCSINPAFNFKKETPNA